VPIKVREMIKKVEDDGWVHVRQRGSHRQYKHPAKPGVVTISGGAGEDLPVGLEKKILKQAGL
jgi:predicted RNA binding protein YcfA (HicA-like mRNA interferase family)